MEKNVKIDTSQNVSISFIQLIRQQEIQFSFSVYYDCLLFSFIYFVQFLLFSELRLVTFNWKMVNRKFFFIYFLAAFKRKGRDNVPPTPSSPLQD